MDDTKKDFEAVTHRNVIINKLGLKIKHFDFDVMLKHDLCFQIAHETSVKAQIKLQLRDVKHNQCIVTRSLEATQKVGHLKMNEIK